MPNTPVSPKVNAAGSSGAVTVIVLWAINQYPAVAALPGDVKFAVAAIIVGIVTWLAGYVVADPARILVDIEGLITRAAARAGAVAAQAATPPPPPVVSAPVKAPVKKAAAKKSAPPKAKG